MLFGDAMLNFRFKDTLEILPASNGVEWLKESWSIFTLAPVKILGATIIYLLFNMLLGLIPVAGPLLSFLLFPATSAGLIYFISSIDNNSGTSFAYLFQFINKKFILTGAIMGLLALCVGAALGLIAFGTFYLLGLGLGTIFILIVFLVLTIGYFCVIAIFWLSIPILVFHDDVTISDALKLAYNAVKFNWLPLIVNGLVCIILMALGSLIIVGALIMIPICFICMYCAYKDILIQK